LSTCAICKIDREAFTKEGKDFDYHLEHEHNIWTSVKFQSMLKNVDREDLSPNQLSAYLKIKQDLLSWMPSGVTGYLGKHGLTLDKAQGLLNKGMELFGQGKETANNMMSGIQDAKAKADEAVSAITKSPEAPKEGEAQPPKEGEAQPPKEGGE